MREFEEVELVRRKKVNKEEEKKKKSVIAILFNRRKNSRMMLLLIALFVTGVLLSGSTYAWFTANYTVSVSSIDVTVASGSGIQISTNATNWKAIVNTDEINAGYTGHTNQMPSGQLNPVSTVKTITSDRLTMYKGVVKTNAAGQYILTTTALTDTAGTAGDYMAFDLFLKSDYSAATQIYLTSGSGVVHDTDGTDSGIQNAARVAFLLLGNTSSGDTAANMQGLTGGEGLADDKALVYFWEPNYDTHTSTGVNNAVNEYGIASSDIAIGSDNDQVTYYGVRGALDETANVRLGLANSSHATAGSNFEEITVDYLTKTTTTDNTAVFTLLPGVTKMRVYMWIEGQDVDCENGASGGAISFNLQLTTLSE